MKSKLITLLATLSISALTACNKGTSSDSADTSTSGIAASSVGGALSNSSASGTQASMKYQKPTYMSALLPEALASGSCPTFKTTDSTCTTSGSSMWLNYAGCSFRTNVSWTGVQQLSMSAGTTTCGTFPNPGANGTLYRQFVSGVSTSTPGTMSLATTADGATIDDASANLSNFDNASIATIHNGGYGSAVSFDGSGARNSLVIGEHITLSGVYDHSLSGSLSLSEGSGQRSINGQVKLYHNLLRVVATSTFTNVIHTDVCCWPVGGAISTVYSAGSTVAPTVLGSKVVGKTETLTFSGSCGSGTLTDTDGTSKNVSFNRCF